MRFGIVVNEGPYTHQASDSALQFAERRAREGTRDLPRLLLPRRRQQRHALHRSAAGRPQSAARLERTRADKHTLDLVVCIAAAQRRGILDANEAKRQGKDGDNIAPGFRISGLGQLIEAGIQADRLVVFGD